MCNFAMSETKTLTSRFRDDVFRLMQEIRIGKKDVFLKSYQNVIGNSMSDVVKRRSYCFLAMWTFGVMKTL